ncbi:Signal transduction histidine kinase [Pedobacter westerhofensis]|uniref:histidine kinase n=1 Tax=Pedobacter westerhofensis TaxID=425512 RepID=A0A521CXM4_9SPHI|nr:sensor histidine kinase [Pedobacter westerhofensis]SMO64197.1 Signal transduction histidine kinase [Pedobacter westerhofensis]
MKNLIIVLFLLTVKFTFAQPYYFKHYQVENGLSHNTVYGSIQDSRGFMWFGTKDGLNRFDGYSFKSYRHDPANPRSIGSDIIHKLYNDQHQVLWIGTSTGLYRYEPIHEEFLLLPQTAAMGIDDFCSDRQGNIWIISNFVLYRLDHNAKSFYSFENKVNFSTKSITMFRDGSIWLSTLEGTIEKYNPGTAAFESHLIIPPNKSNDTRCVAKIAETADGQLIIGTTNDGIKLYDLKTKALRSLARLNKDKTPIFVRDIESAANGEYWIGTESGIYVYNSLSDRITHLQKQGSNTYSLSDNAIYTICRDREGGMWAGTFFGGINYYSSQYAIFNKYLPQKESNSISGSDVREICKDGNGDIWIGTEDAGLNKLDVKTGFFSSFKPDGTSKSIAYSNIHGLLVDGSRLWIATFEHGLDIMDISSGKVIRHYTGGKGNNLRSNFIISFCKTREGQIIVATVRGIYVYNREKDNFDPIPGLPFVFYNTVMEDSEGRIWAGTVNEGVYSFRLQQRGLRNYRSREGKTRNSSHNSINGIFEDSRKNMWFTTDGGGLCKYDRQLRIFKHYTSRNGFPSNILFKIEEDDDHKLWISSSRGLIRFDPLKETLKIYSRSNGLLTDQFNYHSSFKDTDGRMYFGSVRGLISFQPRQLYAAAYAAPVYMTAFQIDNNQHQQKENLSLLARSTLFTDTILLNSSQSSFSIDFAAISFFSPDMTEYAYKMKGLYKDWEYLKTNRKVYFTKLAAGDYTFEARALINGSDDWSKKNVKILIRVLPPLWKSPLAYALYAILLVALAYYLLVRYHQQIEKKNLRRMEIFENEKEKEIYHAKIEFFTNVAHEIRTPLTLIKGPMEKLVKQAVQIPEIKKNLKIMERSTERLFTLTNQLLDFRKTETSGFSLSFVRADIAEMLADIVLDFQESADRRNIGISLSVPALPCYAYIDMEAFHKIISNLVDNGLKYGRKMLKISLSVAEGDEMFRIRVSSDGKHIPAELADKIFEPFYRMKETDMKPGTGIGLSISRSLAELHNGYLRLENTAAEANIFTVALPVHQLVEFNLNGKWKKM